MIVAPSTATVTFQSTRPRGARPSGGAITVPNAWFQSTRPRGARPPVKSVTIPAARFQSTRPRGARPPPPCRFRSCRRVSIHAPAWGATVVDARSGFFDRCFNPRARVGRDPCSPRRPRRDRCFNPRARVGRDRTLDNSNAPLVLFQSTRPRGARRLPPVHHGPHRTVSIHAPAWGATPIAVEVASTASRFNPRARVGRDIRPQGGTDSSSRFQSTRPRGARPPRTPWADETKTCFNPRARVGRDDSIRYVTDYALKFQSTRPRGARHAACTAAVTRGCVSIHAPAWGATLL